MRTKKASSCTIDKASYTYSDTTMNRNTHHNSIALAVTCALLMAAGAAQAAAAKNSTPASDAVSEQASPPNFRVGQATTKFSLPAQPLADSLRSIAAATNSNILFDRSLVSGLTAAPLHADLSIDKALAELLRDTNLTTRSVDDKTVMIVSRTKETSTSRVRAALEKTAWSDSGSRKGLRVAQSDNSSSTSTNSSSTNSEQNASENVDQNSQSVGLQEIVVTAQKREERLIEVPISIVALTSEDLAKRHVLNIDDLNFSVPGVAVTQNGGAQRRIQIRGLSNAFGTQALVGTYLDEVPLSTGASGYLDLRTYDLDRVEVLRGPQGTLYGEGSVGGTIRFITRDPRLDRFEMSADAQLTAVEHGSAGHQIQAMVNAPLIDGTLGLRIASTYGQQGGWIDQPASDGKDFNSEDVTNTRVKLLWQPSEVFSANVMAILHRSEPSMGAGEDEDGNFTQYFGLTLTPKASEDYDIFNLKLAYSPRNVQLLSSTSYRDSNKKTDNFGYSLPLFSPTDRFGVILFAPDGGGDKILTQELRLSNVGLQAWQWTIGGYYRDWRREFPAGGGFYFAPENALSTDLILFTGAQSGFESKSWAAFGDTSYQLTDRLTAGVGLRYYKDSQDNLVAPFQSDTFSSTNPRAYARYQLQDNAYVYSSAGKGFRSGGYNAENLPSYDPETVWTYELGTKIALRRFSSDVALFYSDYQDYQAVTLGFTSQGPTNFAQNSGKVRIRGVEWAFSWVPVDDWKFDLGGTWVESEFREVGVGGAYAVGDPLDLTPKLMLNSSAERGFTLGGKAGYVRADYSYRGRSAFRNRNVFGPSPWYVGYSDVIQLVNLSASIQWSDSLSFGVFGQNLLNDRGWIESPLESAANRARPRTFGVQVGVRFD